MDFDALLKLTSSLPCFDLPLLIQALDDRREVIRVQLSRWMKQGKVIGLRRGIYTLSETYRHVLTLLAVYDAHQGSYNPLVTTHVVKTVAV